MVKTRVRKRQRKQPVVLKGWLITNASDGESSFWFVTKAGYMNVTGERHPKVVVTVRNWRKP